MVHAISWAAKWHHDSPQLNQESSQQVQPAELQSPQGLGLGGERFTKSLNTAYHYPLGSGPLSPQMAALQEDNPGACGAALADTDLSSPSHLTCPDAVINFSPMVFLQMNPQADGSPDPESFRDQEKLR